MDIDPTKSWWPFIVGGSAIALFALMLIGAIVKALADREPPRP